jgi:hypothetical protein
MIEASKIESGNTSGTKRGIENSKNLRTIENLNLYPLIRQLVTKPFAI